MKKYKENKKFDEYFDFRIATMNDIDDIMSFIGSYWSDNHILSKNKELFIYQYTFFSSEDNINVFLMLDKNENIKGMIGYVIYSKDSKRKYVSSAITKVSSDVKIPMIGVEFMKRFYNYVDCVESFSYGANPKTILPIFEKCFKHNVGIMDQYYLVNDEIDNYEIAILKNRNDFKDVLNKTSLVEFKKINDVFELDNFDFDIKYQNIAYKSKEYYIRRFFDHPIYKYNSYFIYSSLGIQGIIFTRKICINGSYIIRIVDFVGNLDCISKCNNEFRKLLIDEKSEYIDLLTKFFPEDILLKAGFEKLDVNRNDLIIPTYFEPFVQENVAIYFETTNEDLVIFKADGDQDRPNIL